MCKTHLSLSHCCSAKALFSDDVKEFWAQQICNLHFLAEEMVNCLSFYILSIVIPKPHQQVSPLTHNIWSEYCSLSTQLSLWLAGRLGVEVDFRQMFIRFRKPGIAGIISKCAYCSLMTGTRLFYINKSDDADVFRLLWEEEHACDMPNKNQRETRLNFGINKVKYYIFKPNKSSVLVCVLKIMYHT